MINKNLVKVLGCAVCLIQVSALAEENYLLCPSHIGCSVNVNTLPNSTAKFDLGSDFPLTNLNAEYTVSVAFPCRGSSGTIELYATANDGGTWGGPAYIDKTNTYNLIGKGPLKFVDRNPQKTQSKTFDSSCELNINYSYKLDSFSASSIVTYLRGEVDNYLIIQDLLVQINSIVPLANVVRTNIEILDPLSTKMLLENLKDYVLKVQIKNSNSRAFDSILNKIGILIETEPAVNPQNEYSQLVIDTMDQLITECTNLQQSMTNLYASKVVNIKQFINKSLNYVTYEPYRSELLNLDSKLK